MDSQTETVTDETRARALESVLLQSELQLGLNHLRDDAEPWIARVRRVLRFALKGGLDERKYRAMFFVNETYEKRFDETRNKGEMG